MAGGALGSLARWLVAEWIAAMPWSAGFPYGTLLVNVAGAFGIGIFSELLLEGGLWNPGSGIRALIFAGIFGGFTTFSAFSLEAVSLFERGSMGQALGYVTLSVVLSIGGLMVGLMIARGIWA